MAGFDVTPGATFDEWTVVEYRPSKSVCECSCGKKVLVLNSNLTRGQSKRCKSCSMKIVARTRERTPTRKVLRHLPNAIYMRVFLAANNAISRCTDKSHVQWKDWGGRGIKVCRKWLINKFKFVEYLATLPGYDDPSLILDRKDNDKGYEPGNLQFVSRSGSNRNRRAFGHLQLHGEDGRFEKKLTY